MSIRTSTSNTTAGSIPRRRVLQLSATAAMGLSAPALVGCGGSRGDANSGEITLATWGIPSEVKAFKAIIDRFRRARPEATVKLEVKPADGYQSSMDTRLAAGSAPDLMRLTNGDVGYYAKAGAIVDLSDYLDKGHGDAFETTFWNVVKHEGRPYALPHHTDTIALFYNVAAVDKVGVRVPRRIEDSWTWEQFIDVSKEMKSAGIGKYSFAMNWQQYSPRWLPFLHQHGGRLLTDEFDGPAIDDVEGIETIAWTQKWFENGLVPPTTSIRSTEAIEVLFANETIPMMLNGNWLIPHLIENMTADWGVTYMIRDAQMASDLGGNAVAVTKDSKNPELAASFLDFLTNEENMRLFVTEAQFLPVRKALLDSQLRYEQRPEEMALFKEQAAKTVPERFGRLLAQPDFGKQIAPTVLEEQLELAFKKGQSPDTTATNIAAGIREALS